jgi:hypothetical protein
MYYKMPKFDIYMIWGKAQDGNILRYYGSTSNFIKRKYNHKKNYEGWVKNGRPNNKKCSAFFIIDNGDWRMEKIDEIDGELWEARKKEGEYIKNNECVNILVASRNMKEWYEDNKEVILEKKKKYRAINKDKLAEKDKQYKLAHKDEITKKRKEYYKKNINEILKKRKEHHKKNYNLKKNEISEKRKEKITCECGSEIRKSDIAQHRKTKKHINLLSNNELNV